MVLFLLGLVAAVALIAPAAASAAGEPDIGLDQTAPEQALLGSTQQVQLLAKNPATEVRGYNLSFREVLPEGVAYVAGSSTKVAPLVLADEPEAGETTLLFENVSDLSAGSAYALSFEVEPSRTFFKLTGTHEYTSEAEAFISPEPRRKPNFAANGEVVPGSYDGHAADPATTELTAIEIQKSEPSPEGEILRGLHEHQTVYTLTVKNNDVGPTEGTELRSGEPDAIGIEDYLPAGLEFLGCGTTDNTTDAAGTNPDSAEEYPGSGAIDPGNAPTVPNCIAPYYVATEEVDPPGPQPLGIYTHVKWEGPESLAAGEEYVLEYVAAIPILRNSLDWAGAEPSAEGLGQIANLDNNQGPETADEEELTNVAHADGRYEGVFVQDTDEMTRTAEDLAIQKTVDQSQIFDDAKSIWSLHLETSEYRWDEPVSITDELPNGLCPLGSRNFEGGAAGPTEPTKECEASEPAKFHPVVKYVRGGGAAAGTEEEVEYSLAEEQEAGGYKLTFDDSTVKALAHLEPSQELLITFPTATQTFYQDHFEDANPILTGDTWTNQVEAQGTAFNRCYTEEAGLVTADPNCEAPDTDRIFPAVTGGIPVTDVSAASQEAGGVEIEKTVRENDGLVPTECEGPASEYVKGLVSAKEPNLPRYRPGDEICWRLVVRFASALYAGRPVVSDFIPTDEEYVRGSAVKGEANTVDATFDEAAANAEEALEWEVGNAGAESVENEQVFEWRFKTKMKATPASDPGEISGNLMKFVYSNTEGETFPLRDRAEVERAEPALELKKRVLQVNGATAGEEAIVQGGDKVTYGIEIPNDRGTLKAEDIEVWDELPPGLECGVNVPAATISDNGTCEGTGRIVWSEGIAVAPGATPATLTYVAKIPGDFAPGHKFENEAGITQFKSETNTGEKFTYFPEDNIDPAAPEANTGPARDSASVKTVGASLHKSVTNESGKNEAAIGEVVHYTVTATIPAGSTLFGNPAITDQLPTGVEYVPDSLEWEATGAAGGVEAVTESEGVVAAKLASPYVNSEGSGDDVVTIEFDARVRNIATNVRGTEITNRVLLTFEDNPAVPGVTELPAQATARVVEPNLVVGKAQSTAPSGIVSPGETITYQVTATNPTAPGHVSTANEVELKDPIPAGMELVPETEAEEEAEGRSVGGGTIVWKLGALAPGATASRTYSLKVEEPATAAATFANTVTGTAQSLPDEAGGAEQPETRVAAFEEGAYKAAKGGYESSKTVTVRLVGATVKKEVAPEEATIGASLTYTLHMKLPPNINFYDTTLVDTLPDGAGYDETISAECVKGCGEAVEGTELGSREGAGGTTLVGWYFGKLAAAPEERELVVKFKGHVDDTDSGGAEVEAGDTLTNKVVGLYDEAEGTAPTEVPTPGSSGFSEETNVAAASTAVVEPHLTMTKSVSAEPTVRPGVVEPGSKITYTVTLTNDGSSPAYEAQVEDAAANTYLTDITPIEGAGFVSSEPGEALVWTVPEIDPGETVTITYTAELIASKYLATGQHVVNATDLGLYWGLEKAERERAGPLARPYGGPLNVKELEIEVPDVELEKTAGSGGAGGDVATVGVAFPWHLVARDNSGAVAKEAKVVDTMPENWTYVAGSGEVGGTAAAPARSTVEGHEVLTWELPGELTEAEISYEAIPGAAAAVEPGLGPNLNTARATAEDATGSPEDLGGDYAATDDAEAELVAPQLKLEKTPDGGEAKAGEETSYTITVTNEGGGVADGVTVADVLSAGQEYKGPATATPATGFAEVAPEADTPAAGETTLGWTIASIAPGASVEIEVPIRPLPSLAENAEVTDRAEASTPQEVAPTAADEGSFVVTRETDLALHKKASPATVNAGEEIEYDLEVADEGPSDATGIVVTDPLPEFTEIVGAPGPGCTVAARVVTCELAELKAAAGENTHTFHFKVEVDPGTKGTIENTATVTGDQTDGNPANDESTAETPLGGVADLSIVKTGPEEPVLLGQDFTYTLQVENSGPSSATETLVTDALPAQVRFLAATTTAGTCDSAPGGVLSCELGTLRPHAGATVEVEVEAAEVGSFENEADVESPVTDPDETDNHSKAPAQVLPAADLSITKTAPAEVEPNGELTYELQVENQGPSVAHDVVITDPLPAGTELSSLGEGCAAVGGVVTCEVAGGELAVGEAADFEVTVHVPFALAGTSVTNTASVAAAEGDPHPEDNSSSVSTTVGPAADLSITKSMGRAEAGKPLVYTLAVTNHGPSASSGVTVKDTLPAGTSFDSAAPSQGTCAASGQAVSCKLGALAAGGSAQVSITVDVATDAPGTLRNVATVEGPEPDPDASNNQSAVEGPVTPVPADPAPPARAASTSAAGTPNLKVVKTADTSTPQVGTPFGYDVAISNLGGAEAKNVKVIDTLSGPAKVVSIAAGPGKCAAAGSKVECTIPSVPVGKTVHVTYSVVAEAAGELSNTASAMAANGEQDPANNRATKVVHPTAPKASFTLAKKASRPVVRGGGRVGFTITLRNGPTALTDARVCDRLPTSLVFLKAAGAAFVNGEACWRERYVAPHKVLRLHLMARALKDFKARSGRGVASATASNAKGKRKAAATVRIEPASAGAPGGVTG